MDEKTGQAAKTGLFNRVRRKPLADCIRVRYGSANSKRLTKYQGAQGFLGVLSLYSLKIVLWT